MAHTVGATGVGAQVAVVFGEAWLGAASGIMTLAILVFSEIIPQTIGAKYWRSLASMLPPTLKVIMVSLLPFVWLSKLITSRIGGNNMMWMCGRKSAPWRTWARIRARWMTMNTG